MRSKCCGNGEMLSPREREQPLGSRNMRYNIPVCPERYSSRAQNWCYSGGPCGHLQQPRMRQRPLYQLRGGTDASLRAMPPTATAGGLAHHI